MSEDNLRTENHELRGVVDLFASRDVEYFKNYQYRSNRQLNSRINLHDKYSTAKIDWFAWLHTLIDWSHVHDVLEVGCGTGLFWASLPRMSASPTSVVVSDLSSAMVDETLGRAQSHVNNVTGIVADVQDLPIEDSSVDLVIANQMLYHVPDLNKGLAELQRVLKPGGTIIASTVGPRHLQELFELKATVFGGSTQSSHADVFSSSNGTEILSAYFRNVVWTSFEDRLLCTDERDVEAYLRSTPPGEDASVSELEVLQFTIADRFSAGNGTFEVTKDVGVFSARRI
ncbi:MAG: class I SAM-dependent methyltransferase [Acidimicrobiales bacterium]